MKFHRLFIYVTVIFPIFPSFHFPFAVHPVINVRNQLVGSPFEKDVTIECNVEASPKSINYWIKDVKDGKCYCVGLSTFVAVCMQCELHRQIGEGKEECFVWFIDYVHLSILYEPFNHNFNQTKDFKYSTRMDLFGYFRSFILTFWHLAILDFPFSHSQWERIV